MASIPSKFETVLLANTKERQGFGGGTHRFTSSSTDVPGPGFYGAPKTASVVVRNAATCGSVSRKGYGNMASKGDRFAAAQRQAEKASLSPGPGTYQVADNDYANSSCPNAPSANAAAAAASPVHNPQASLVSQESSMIRADARSMQLRSHTAPASANPSVAAAAFAGAGAEAPPATMALNAPATPGVGGTGSGGGPPLSPVASFSSMSSGRGIAPRPRAKGNQVATHIMVRPAAYRGEEPPPPIIEASMGPGKYAPEKCTFRSARDYMRRPSSFMLNGNGGNASTKNKRGAKAPRKPAPGDYQVAASLDFLTHQGSLVRTFQGSPRTTLQQQQRATTSMVMSGGKEVMINAVTGRPVPPEAPQQVLPMASFRSRSSRGNFLVPSSGSQSSHQPGPGTYNPDKAWSASRYDAEALAINSSMFAATQSDRFGRSQNTFNSQGRRGTFHLDQQQQQQQLNHNSSQNISSSSSSSPAAMAAKNGMRGALPAFRDQVSRFDQPLTTRLGATPGPAFYAPSTAAVEQSTKRSFIVNENGKWV